MKTIITGASGNYGRAAVERVLAKGVPAEDLILMSRTPAKLDVFAERGCVLTGSSGITSSANRCASSRCG